MNVLTLSLPMSSHILDFSKPCQKNFMEHQATGRPTSLATATGVATLEEPLVDLDLSGRPIPSTVAPTLRFIQHAEERPAQSTLTPIQEDCHAV